MKTILSLLLALPVLAQQAVTINITIPDDAIVSLMRWRASAAIPCSTVPLVEPPNCGIPNAAQISVGINAAVTSITVTDASLLTSFPVDLLIENEVVRACSKTVNVISLTGCASGGRGKYGSAAAGHAISTPIHLMFGSAPSDALKRVLRDALAGIFGSYPSPLMQTQITTRDTAEAARKALVDGAVQ